MTEEWFDAAKRGDVDTLQRLIDSGMPIDSLDELLCSALSYAVSRCYIDVITMLLDRGADPNLRLVLNSTPMTRAAERCCPRFFEQTDDRPLKLLTAAGGQLGLQEAILLGDADLARRVSDEVPLRNAWGALIDYLPAEHLIEAVSISTPEVVKFLLDRGADIEGDNSVGSTALMKAARTGRMEMVSLLLDRGADVNHRDWTRQSPLSEAAAGKHRDIVNLLLARGAKRNLLECVLLEDVERVTALLLAGADLNAEYGTDPLLTQAAWTGNAEIVQLLFRFGFGAELDRPDLKADALCKAAEHGHAEVVQILLQHGFDPTMQVLVQNWVYPPYGTYPKTPLDFARANGHALVVQILEAAIDSGKKDGSEERTHD